jgi:hypothetical protein
VRRKCHPTVNGGKELCFAYWNFNPGEDNVTVKGSEGIAKWFSSSLNLIVNGGSEVPRGTEFEKSPSISNFATGPDFTCESQKIEQI